MAVLEDLSEEEKYLLAILLDESGVDIAEFAWQDPDAKNDEGKHDWVFRCWPFQYFWYRCGEKRQIDQSARAIGKALDVDTPIMTPGGWTTMGQLESGDLVYAPSGRPVPIIEAFAVRNDRPCYEIAFSTGDSIVADAEHLWTVVDKKDGSSRDLTTQQILDAGLRKTASEWRWHIDVARPVTGLRHLPLPISPWLLGYWLGDGTSRTGQITVGDQDVAGFVARVTELGFTAKVREPHEGCSAHMVSLAGPDGTQFGRLLTAAGAKLPDRPGLLRGKKRIPEIYLIASVEDRLELLRGFMDADGHATKLKRAEFDLMDFDLAEQFTSLVASLGERPSWRTEDATLNGRVVGQRRRVGWQPTRFVPFSYARKAGRIGLSETVMSRSIRSIQRVPSRPVRCITVDSDDHLFLAGRSLISTHNSVGIQMRAFAFPFINPGQEMLISAPELIHLDPVTKYIEDRLLSVRMSRDMLKKSGQSNGINKRPFEAKFTNGAKIIGRIPQKDGKGVKGQHPRKLEIDEGQDYPDPGWVELMETLRYGDENSTWRIHGVSRGVRDRYYKLCQPESGYYVHKLTAMHRPDWTPEERKAKAEYYGSRNHPDYRRNILGLHGDALSPLFVLSRLMQCFAPEGHPFTQDIYYSIRLTDERLRDSGLQITQLLQLPGSHLTGKYTRFWAGADIGMTNHPTEILVFGEEHLSKQGGGDGPTMRLALLTRIHLERISAADQRAVFRHIFDHYSPMGAFSMDKTGLGLPIYQDILAEGGGLDRAIRGYNFSEKLVVGWDKGGRPDEPDWGFEAYDPEENAIMANVLEYSSDQLRVMVDQKKLWMPWDTDVIKEFQGQSYYLVKSNTNPYGKKEFSKGTFHALDAARMAVLGYTQSFIEPLLNRDERGEIVELRWLDENDFGPGFDLF